MVYLGMADKRMERTELRKAVSEWINAHEEEMLEDLKSLLRVNSVKGAYTEGKPFGEGPSDALNIALSICERYGFKIQNYDNYVGTADYNGELPKQLDILAHMDVVPAGDGWTVCDPFDPVIKDGRIYGRGTSDDKGPAIAALYAMRALKENGVDLSRNVRLILGTDEENGSSDIEHYYRVEKEAPMTFSPDAEFPIINIEKGMFKGTLSKEFVAAEGEKRVLSFKAGVASNAVPGKAECELKGFSVEELEKAAAEVERETAAIDRAKKTKNSDGVQTEGESLSWGVTFQFLEDDKKVLVTALGEAGHASTPWMGSNALVAMLMFLDRIALPDSEQTKAMKNLLKLFPYGVTDGSGIGIQMCDEESGALTNTLDLIEVSETGLSATFDSRCPVSANKENCQDVAELMIKKAGFALETAGMIEPHVVDKNSELVQTLLSAYEEETGLEGKCLAIGGGTYVHHLENGVAFGSQLPGIDTHMHGPDEFMDLENLKIAVKIYAISVFDLCK